LKAPVAQLTGLASAVRNRMQHPGAADIGPAGRGIRIALAVDKRAVTIAMGWFGLSVLAGLVERLAESGYRHNAATAAWAQREGSRASVPLEQPAEA
jgi:hypothetical protein